jgi:colicin import membrane protein
VTLSRSYKNALIAALAFHFSIVIVLLIEPSSHQPPVLELTDHPDMTQSQAAQTPPQPEPIKAVAVDAAEVMKTVNQLKEQRAHEQAVEHAHQQQLQKQADMARRARIEEQQRLQRLKNESEKIAIAHKKQLEEDKKHLEQVAKEKAAEEKHLADMKKLQQKEAEKLAEIKKKQDEAKAINAKAQAKRDAEAKQQKDVTARAEAEQKRQQAIQQASANAEKNARIAGEVDRYKALIISAISRQWILPENAQTNLSSEFRIRLAPDGSVLEVTLTRGSGDSVLDHSAQSAIYKASPLPVPTDPLAFNTFREISLTVRPENARG